MVASVEAGTAVDDERVCGRAAGTREDEAFVSLLGCSLADDLVLALLLPLPLSFFAGVLGVVGAPRDGEAFESLDRTGSLLDGLSASSASCALLFDDRSDDDTVVEIENAVAGVAGAEKGEAPRWLDALDVGSLIRSVPVSPY